MPRHRPGLVSRRATQATHHGARGHEAPGGGGGSEDAVVATVDDVLSSSDVRSGVRDEEADEVCHFSGPSGAAEWHASDRFQERGLGLVMADTAGRDDPAARRPRVDGRDGRRRVECIPPPPRSHLLGQIMKAAVADGLITISPCTGVDAPSLPEPQPPSLADRRVRGQRGPSTSGRPRHTSGVQSPCRRSWETASPTTLRRTYGRPRTRSSLRPKPVRRSATPTSVPACGYPRPRRRAWMASAPTSADTRRPPCSSRPAPTSRTSRATSVTVTRTMTLNVYRAPYDGKLDELAARIDEAWRVARGEAVEPAVPRLFHDTNRHRRRAKRATS
jgi:hypothetical protein